MRTNGPSISCKRTVTRASLALLSVLTGAACGGNELGTGSTPDPGASHEAGSDGQEGVSDEAQAGQEPDADHEAGEGDAADTGASDALSRVPANHRSDDAQCVSPRPEGTCPSGPTAGGSLSCASDGDCIDGGADGRCTGCYCTYDACQTDVDCGTGKVCACHGSAYSSGGNSCQPGNCRIDSDCGAGGYCSPAHGTLSNCGNVSGYYCHTPKDACTNDSDCSADNDICTWSAADGRWMCEDRQFCT